MDHDEPLSTWHDDGQPDGNDATQQEIELSAQIAQELDTLHQVDLDVELQLIHQSLDRELGTIDTAAEPGFHIGIEDPVVDPGFTLGALAIGTVDSGFYVNPELGTTTGFNFLPGPHLPEFTPLTGGDQPSVSDDPLAPQVGEDPLESGTLGDPGGEIRNAVNQELIGERSEIGAWASAQGAASDPSTSAEYD